MLALPRYRRSRRIAPLLLLVLLAGPAMSSSMIVNGNFDDPVPRNGMGGGWSTEHIDGAGGWQAGTGASAPSYRLNEAGSPSSDPRIWQTVEGFEPGQVYTLHGDYALGYGGGSPDHSFELRVDGAAVLSIGPAPEHEGGGTVFVSFQASFTATATSHEIEIAAECNGSDHDYYVDNITLDGLTPAAEASWSVVKALYR